MARSVDERQMKLGAVPIAGININTKSRDDIPRILGGVAIYLRYQKYSRRNLQSFRKQNAGECQHEYRPSWHGPVEDIRFGCSEIGSKL